MDRMNDLLKLIMEADAGSTKSRKPDIDTDIANPLFDPSKPEDNWYNPKTTPVEIYIGGYTPGRPAPSAAPGSSAWSDPGDDEEMEYTVMMGDPDTGEMSDITDAVIDNPSAREDVEDAIRRHYESKRDNYNGGDDYYQESAENEDSNDVYNNIHNDIADGADLNGLIQKYGKIIPKIEIVHIWDQYYEPTHTPPTDDEMEKMYRDYKAAGKTDESSVEGKEHTMENLDAASLKYLAGVKKTLEECGMMGSNPMPPMPASINATAGSASELTTMLKDLMGLAGIHKVEPSHLGVENPPAVVSTTPSISGNVSGSEVMRSVLDKLNPGHGEEDSEMETDEAYHNTPADPNDPPPYDGEKYAHHSNPPGAGKGRGMMNHPNATLENIAASLFSDYEKFIAEDWRDEMGGGTGSDWMGVQGDPFHGDVKAKFSGSGLGSGGDDEEGDVEKPVVKKKEETPIVGKEKLDGDLVNLAIKKFGPAVAKRNDWHQDESGNWFFAVRKGMKGEKLDQTLLHMNMRYGKPNRPIVVGSKDLDVNESGHELEIDTKSIELDDVDHRDYPDFADAYISYAEWTNGTPLNDAELDDLNNSDYGRDLVSQKAHGFLESLNEIQAGLGISNAARKVAKACWDVVDSASGDNGYEYLDRLNHPIAELWRKFFSSPHAQNMEFVEWLSKKVPHKYLTQLAKIRDELRPDVPLDIYEADRDNFTVRHDADGPVKVYPPSGPKNRRAAAQANATQFGSKHIGKQKGRFRRGEVTGRAANTASPHVIGMGKNKPVPKK